MDTDTDDLKKRERSAQARPAAPAGSGRTHVDSPRASDATTGVAARPVSGGPPKMPLADRDFEARYHGSEPLGDGAMGVVTLVRDQHIGRDVALKQMHGQHRENRPDLQTRFLREAKVQGQLEHPAVVPVYDIGMDTTGGPYFSMKCVRGLTLADVVEGLRRGDPEFLATYTRRRVLTALSRVCLCVAFAHERGVVHRDLKPANIMLGDYGEVYVLDWGIAQIAGADEGEGSPLNLPSNRVHETQSGFVIGTPGYMAPEQARGERETYGGRSDIYSLGAILFEVMALRRLHPATEVEPLLLSTVEGVDARPCEVAPDLDLPGELDVICTRATSLNPNNRYASARDMNDAIEAILDGDRDRARRAQLAGERVVQARAALEAARGGGPGANGKHRKGVGALLQALALEPEHPEARSELVRLLIEPGDKLPQEAVEELKSVRWRDRARLAKFNAVGLLGWTSVVPVALWMGVREWSWFGGLGLGSLLLLLYFGWMWRNERVSGQFVIPALMGAFCLFGLMGVFLGPLFVVPGLAAAGGAAFMVGLRAERRVRIIINLMAQSVVLIPTLLQYTGVTRSVYVFEAGRMCIEPGLTALPESATWAFLVLTNIMTISVGTLLTGRAVEALLQAERANFATAWRLRQFLPRMIPEDHAAYVARAARTADAGAQPA